MSSHLEQKQKQAYNLGLGERVTDRAIWIYCLVGLWKVHHHNWISLLPLAHRYSLAHRLRMGTFHTLSGPVELNLFQVFVVRKVQMSL